MWELLEAANYLDIKPLLDLATAKVALKIKDLNGTEILDYFNLEEDLTEEEARIMEEEFEKKQRDEREQQINLEKLKVEEPQKEVTVDNQNK
jgi:hypothetical protein